PPPRGEGSGVGGTHGSSAQCGITCSSNARANQSHFLPRLHPTPNPSPSSCRRRAFGTMGGGPVGVCGSVGAPLHPAYSVILFTTASGAGLGLLVWLAFFGLLDLVPTERWLGFAGFALAFALVTGGLLASTAHLGRPERAWRAFSQWRTSGLSRGGGRPIAT